MYAPARNDSCAEDTILNFNRKPLPSNRFAQPQGLTKQPLLPIYPSAQTRSSMSRSFSLDLDEDLFKPWGTPYGPLFISAHCEPCIYIFW